jgi:hypothetical protein
MLNLPKATTAKELLGLFKTSPYNLTPSPWFTF